MQLLHTQDWAMAGATHTKYTMYTQELNQISSLREQDGWRAHVTLQNCWLRLLCRWFNQAFFNICMSGDKVHNAYTCTYIRTTYYISCTVYGIYNTYTYVHT